MAERQGGIRVMGRLLALVAPLAGYMAFAIVCGVAGFACATGIPVVAACAAWLVATEGAAVPLDKVCIALAVMAVARGVLHYLEQRTNHYIAFRLLAHIRSLVFGALRRLAPAKLAGSDRGSLISTLTSDIELLEVFFAHTISPVCIAALMSCLMVGLIGSADASLGALAAVAYAVVGIVVPLAFGRTSQGLGAQVRDGAGDLSGYVLDGLRGLKELCQFGAEDAYLRDLDERSYGLVASQRGLSSLAGTSQAVVGALISAFSLACLLMARNLLAGGAITGVEMVFATVALTSSFGPVIALANLGTSLAATLASGERVLAILDEDPAVEESEDGVEIEFSGAQVHDVSFGYEAADGTREEVLESVSLDIPQGRICGISGKSGSGKSTLLRLIMRFWDVDRGRITLSRERLENIATSSLRANEALVEQDTYLFHDSIRDNLLVAKPDATQAELEEACQAASVHDFVVGLPQGYDTMVGELGDTLSGGERQRLGLARAFLHGAPLLLLDEPTSNLDALNEGAILQSLVERRGERTVLLVSHRASTMAIADDTYAMERGRVS